VGDSSLITILSVVPLLIIGTAIAAAGIAWLSGRRAIRTAVAIVLVAVGVASLFSPIGILLSMAGGALIALVGVVLLVAEYIPRRDV
jgi:hypothetical protein